MRAAITPLGLLLTLAASSAQTDRPHSSWARSDLTAAWNETTAFYRAGLTQHGIVGGSLWLIDGETVAARTWDGYQDGETRAPIDEDTIFHWASITKTLTAIAILQLRDRGLLALDDPAVNYLPELSRVHNPFGPVSEITVRHLLSHSAGFRAATWPWGGDKDWHPFEPPGWAQVEAMLPYTSVEFAPGSRYSYSNPGVVFLGRIIERLTNEDWEVYVHKRIFMPLGLTRSHFDRTPPHLLARRSHSYFANDDGRREARFDFDTGATVSNGGWNAPVGDLATYLSFLMGRPSRAQEDAFVLARSSLEELFLPVVPTGEPDASMGLSIFIEKHAGLTLIGHSGGQNGFISHIYFHRPTRRGYVVAFNTDATSKTLGERRNTRALDRALRNYIVERVFPAMAATSSRTSG
jgi:CubicO group peptidase (beta-lactamase class C family)